MNKISEAIKQFIKDTKRDILHKLIQYQWYRRLKGGKYYLISPRIRGVRIYWTKEENPALYGDTILTIEIHNKKRRGKI